MKESGAELEGATHRSAPARPFHENTMSQQLLTRRDDGEIGQIPLEKKPVGTNFSEMSRMDRVSAVA